jgi:uncharacterized protein (DUF736 family)
MAIAANLNFQTGFNTPDAVYDVYYAHATRNILFLTFYLPEQVATYPGGPPPAPFATYDQYAKWLPWCPDEGSDNANTDTVHGGAGTGFRYPNHYGRPDGPIKDAALGQLVPAYGKTASIGVEIGRRLHGVLNTPIHVINAAIPGSSLALSEMQGFQNQAKWGWFDTRQHVAWAPGVPNALAARLLTILDSAKTAATVDGKELEIVQVFCSLGETDVAEPAKKDFIEDNARSLIDFVRNAIATRGLCTGAAHQLPFIWEKISPNISAIYDVAKLNDVLDKFERDDPAFGTYDTAAVTHNAPPDPHFTSAGIVQRGQLIHDKWLELRGRRYASMSLDDTPTLSELRGKVRQLTERSTAASNEDDAIIDEAINNVLDELYQTAGDSAWWLKHIVQHVLSCDPWTPADLPRVVTRLLEIRRTVCPLEKIEFSAMGHIDGGRVRIVTGCVVSENVDLHCIFTPRRLVSSSEKPVLPRQYIEAVVLGAAYRIVSDSGNAQLELKLKARAQFAMQHVSGDIQKVDRQRRMRVIGNRRAGRYPWARNRGFYAP